MSKMQYRTSIPIHILGRDRDIARTSTNIYFHSTSTIPDWIENVGSIFNVYEGSPSAILEFDEAYYLPGSLCLYDNTGQRIVESCIRRGAGLTELVDAGLETITLPREFSTVTDPVMYLTWLPNHWGHFLTESTSRLWARLAHPELSGMAGFCVMPDPLEEPYAEILSAFDLRAGKNLFSSTQPVRLNKCFVPLASYSNRAESYTVHRDVFAAVSARFSRSPAAPKSPQPVYLSRRRYGYGRSIQYEFELEQRLEQIGVRIAYPEQLSLAEQIGLFNQHRQFIGCWGSAFHSLVFSESPSACVTDVICENIPSVNYLMFDAINGNRANYINSMRELPDKEQIWPSLHLEINPDEILDYLLTSDHFDSAT